MDEAHNLVCPSKAATVHELADEESTMGAPERRPEVQQAQPEPAAAALRPLVPPPGWTDRGSMLRLFFRQGGKYTLSAARCAST